MKDIIDMIKYFPSLAIKSRIDEMAAKLGIKHDLSRVACVESKGSSSKRTLARCHALPRIMQAALGVKAHYVIEVVSEQFFSLSMEEQDKTLIHELMHIPKAFGGGFRHHDYVCRRNVDRLYKDYASAKRGD